MFVNHKIRVIELAGALLLSAALSCPAFAHNPVSTQPVVIQSTAVSPTGTVTELTVKNELTGVTLHYFGLKLDQGTSYALSGTGLDSLHQGMRINATGTLAGNVLNITFFSVAAPASGTSRATTQAETRKSVSGTLAVFHKDFFENGRGEYGLAVRDASDKATQLNVAAIPDSLVIGMIVRADGAPAADGVSLDTSAITILADAPAKLDGTAEAPVTNNVLVLPIKFTNYSSEPWSIAAINNEFQTRVAPYYQEVSYGQQLLNVTVANSGGSWLNAGAAAPAGCDYTAIGNLADAAATAAGYNINSYQNRYYVMPGIGCGWAGLGYVGWGRAWSDGYNALWVYGHELGHNFGLWHAGSLNCGAQVLGGSCGVSEYGDPFDVMGNIRQMHFNSMQKAALNWIPSTSVKVHSSGTQTYQLSPIESGGQSTYAVKIPTSNTKRTYWVEFRQPIGFDSQLSSVPNLGAQIRVGGSQLEFPCSGGCDTELLDMTPATGGNLDDAALLVGQSYTDSTTGVTITVNGATPGASGLLTVSVAMGGLNSTTTTLATSGTPSLVGASVTFTATVTGVAPTGSVNFKDGAASIGGCSASAVSGSGNSRTATCTTSGLALGTHSIAATYSGDGGNAPSTSSALTQTVNSSVTATTTTLATSGTPSMSGASVTFTATVNGIAPTGSVNFKDGSTSIAGCSASTVGGSGNSRTATCSTSALVQGAHSITATYSGDAGNSGSTSAALSQVVNAGGDVVWVEDSVPAGAAVSGDGGDSWTWIASNPGPYSGTLSHQSAVAGGEHQHFFYNATATLSIATGDTLYTYVFLDPANPPTELMLQWYDGSWEHRAYWGANAIGWGTDGSVSRRYMGALPTTGSWVRLAVPAAQVGLEGRTLNGMAFTLVGGRATWDRAGKASGVPSPSTTALVTSGSPSLVNATVTFTATVTGTGPTGSVALADGGVAISGCSAVALAAGAANAKTATCTTNSLIAGTHSIVATYSGDAANYNSSSAALSQVVSASVSGAWVDDSVPTGATQTGDESWTWVSSNPTPYSGALAHQSALVGGVHQHYFYGASATLAVAVGDTLIAYVYLDPANPPSEVMLQWNDGSWEHRAYWGANLIGFGADGTVSRRYMGTLPPTGKWVRLAVPAVQVGLEGRTLNGMAFTLYGGRATWDYAWKSSPWVEDAVPTGAAAGGDAGDTWNWVSTNPAPYSGALAHQSALAAGFHQHYFSGAAATLAVDVGDTLFTYVYLDPVNPPSELMLQWSDGSWEHRAYWGPNLIGLGIDGTVSRRYMGPLPPAGQWVRLAVPATQVGLEGRTINGMAFGLYGGRATWDYASKSSAWVLDTLPTGAAVWSDGGDTWNWVNSNPTPFSGAYAHQSALAAGYHQHLFYGAAATLPVGVGDTLFTYVFLDPLNPPSEVMLQWFDGSWEHRAYWGANQIGLGTDASASRRYMGALPPTGQWVRLAVPAAQVALEGSTLNGMAFTLFGGRATWDFVGK